MRINLYPLKVITKFIILDLLVIYMVKINKNLATRLSAQKLFHNILVNNIKKLDFKEVELISRSFANEFLKLEKENNFFVEKVNLSKELKLIFETADKELDSDILAKNHYSTVSVNKYAYLI